MTGQIEIYTKLDALKNHFKSLGSVLLAFSGGVDSSLLLYVANEVLGEKVIAVTATSDLYFPFELKEAVEFCEKLSVKHLFFANQALSDESFAQNTPVRCYRCKKALFIKLKELAVQHNMNHIIDGTNLDDLKDYRPGLQALEELGILSPLKEAGFSKADIREASRILNLDSWDKPSLACLASRFPYGIKITSDRLKKVRLAEDYLRKIGFTIFRVRHCDETARIELPVHEMETILVPENREKVVRYLKGLGYTYVALDLEGFRSGSLNEVLQEEIYP